MSWLNGWVHRVRTVLHPEAHERDLRDEMALHEELDAAQQSDSGRARRRFGNRTYYQEETRRMTWIGMLDVLRQDARYAWRSLVRTPGFAAMVVVTLALGVGVNAAMFTFLDRLFLRPPAGIQDASSLRRIWVRYVRHQEKPAMWNMISYPRYAAVRDVARPNADVALYIEDNSRYLGRNKSGPPVHVVYATANYFDVLGLRPTSGRFFLPEEDIMGRGEQVAVLGHDFWQSRMGGDTAILGRDVALGLEHYTVIGVAPADFVGLGVQSADMWVPIAAMKGSVRQGKQWWQRSTTYGAQAILRAGPGFDDREFSARATVAMKRLDVAVEGENADSLAAITTGSIIASRGPGELDQEVRIGTRLGGVSLIVLLIACANVVNLLLARAVYRRREIAVRLALGVTRWRLVRLLVTETVLLAALAGSVAVAVAWWGGELLRRTLLPNIEWTESALDGRIVAFTLGVAIAVGLVAGLVPAVKSSRPRLVNALKDGPRDGASRSRLRSALVIAQAALSVVLLVGAALFVRSLRNVQHLDIGYDASRIVVAEVTFESAETQPDSVVARAMTRIGERFAAHPAVEAVAWSYMSPMRGYAFTRFYTDHDSAGSLGERSPSMNAVSRDYFRATGVALVRGATFSRDDQARPPNEIVVNEPLARVLWPGEDALGQCMYFPTRESPCNRVVGVVEASRRMRVIEDETTQFYVPIGSSAYWLGTALLVRTREGASVAVQRDLQRAIRAEFPLGYPYVKAVSDNLEPEYRPWRLGASLFSAMGLLALLVAIIGIYSSVSYRVMQRTHEFGVRAALGAQLGDIVRQVVGEGVRLVGAGVVLGIALALAAGRLVAALLYGVAPGDPFVLGFSALTLLIVAVAAALGPAWRAARIDPVVSLKVE